MADSLDMSPPWVLFCDRGRPAAILPAMRPGEIADVTEWPDGLAQELVAAANHFDAVLNRARVVKLEIDLRKLAVDVERASPSPSNPEEPK